MLLSSTKVGSGRGACFPSSVLLSLHFSWNFSFYFLHFLLEFYNALNGKN
jgi:hypothetical protein